MRRINYDFKDIFFNLVMIFLNRYYLVTLKYKVLFANKCIENFCYPQIFLRVSL